MLTLAIFSHERGIVHRISTALEVQIVDRNFI